MATPETKLTLKAVAPAGKRIDVPIKKATGPGDDKIHTWPHLVRHESLVSIGIILLPLLASVGGAAVLLGYVVAGYAGFYLFCRWVKGADFPDCMRGWGCPRLALTGFLFLSMMAVVFKMLGRHLLNLKYIVVLKTPYFSI